LLGFYFGALGAEGSDSDKNIRCTYSRGTNFAAGFVEMIFKTFGTLSGRKSQTVEILAFIFLESFFLTT